MLVELIIGLASFVIGVPGSIEAYYQIKIQREKEVQRIVSSACDFAYNVYVRNNGKLNDVQKMKAMNIAKKYFKSRSPYKLSDEDLEYHINERVMYIKSLKRKVSFDNVSGISNFNNSIRRATIDETPPLSKENSASSSSSDISKTFWSENTKSISKD